MPSPSPEQILESMEKCLIDLDRLGAGLPAAHLDHAIQIFCKQFNLKEIASISD